MTNNLFFSVIILSLAAGCTSANIDVRPTTGTPGQESVDDVATLLKKGKSDFTDKHFDKAVGHFRKALNIKPESIDAINGLAASYDRLGRFDVAVSLYKSALIQAPDSATTLNNLGYSYYLQKKPDLALVYLREAANRDENTNPLIKVNLRIVSATLKNIAEKSTHAARGKAVSIGHEAGFLHPASKPKKAVRLVRSGSAVYTLFTRQIPGNTRPVPKSRQLAVRHGAAKTPASVHKAVAAAAGTSKTALSAASKTAAAPKQSSAQRMADGKIIVASGAGRQMMAVRMVHYFMNNGHRATSRISNDPVVKNISTIYYKPGQEDAARAISKSLFSIPRLERRDDQTARLYLELGADLHNFDRQLIHLFKMQTKEAIHVEL
jgi:tetratricopeptide (TPR) repeat protein